MVTRSNLEPTSTVDVLSPSGQTISVSVEGVPPSTTSNAVSPLGRGRIDPAASVLDFGHTPLPIPDSAASASKSLEVLRGLTEFEILELLGKLLEQVPVSNS
jgi:hypothetical protein